MALDPRQLSLLQILCKEQMPAVVASSVKNLGDNAVSSVLRSFVASRLKITPVFAGHVCRITCGKRKQV